MGIADFANTISVGKECALLAKNTMYGDQNLDDAIIKYSSANQNIVDTPDQRQTAHRTKGVGMIHIP